MWSGKLNLNSRTTVVASYNDYQSVVLKRSIGFYAQKVMKENSIIK